jgi:hypothetical protein
MSWVVCPYSAHGYDTIVSLHDAVYPTYCAQPEVSRILLAAYPD